MLRLRSDSPFGECPRRHYCSKGAGMGWFSGFFSGKSKEERTQDAARTLPDQEAAKPDQAVSVKA